MRSIDTTNPTPAYIHPRYYNSPPPAASKPALIALGVYPDTFDRECITAMMEIDPRMAFGWAYGSAIKYLWRAGQKGDPAQDYNKVRRCLALARQAAGLIAEADDWQKLTECLDAAADAIPTLE